MTETASHAYSNCLRPFSVVSSFVCLSYIEICELEERLMSLIVEKTGNSAELMSLISELQQQVCQA